MRASLTSATSLIALLVFGGGYAAAGPTAPPEVRPWSIGTIGALPDPVDTAPTAGNYTYQPGTAADAGMTGTETAAPNVAPPPEAKPPLGTEQAAADAPRGEAGRQSNLVGTIGGLQGGLLADVDLTTWVSVDDGAPAPAIIQRTSEAFEAIVANDPTFSDLVPAQAEARFLGHIAPREQPSASVFVGRWTPTDAVRAANGKRARLGAVMITATDSTAPTIVMTAEQMESETESRSRADEDESAGPPITVAGVVSAWDLRKTRASEIGGLRVAGPDVQSARAARGSVGSSTLGYTYTPFSQMAQRPMVLTGAPEAPRPLSVSASVAASHPGLPNWPIPPAPSPMGIGLGSAGVAAAPTVNWTLSALRFDPERRVSALPGQEVDAFPIQSAAIRGAGAGGGPGGAPMFAADQEPVLFAPLMVPALIEESTLGAEALFGEDDPDDDMMNTLMALAAVGISVPMVLMAAGYLLVRRAQRLRALG